MRMFPNKFLDNSYFRANSNFCQCFSLFCLI
nr:MAG TPA: hypothetical protein [Bacteriophage sp.]